MILDLTALFKVYHHDDQPFDPNYTDASIPAEDPAPEQWPYRVCWRDHGSAEFYREEVKSANGARSFLKLLRADKHRTAEAFGQTYSYQRRRWEDGLR